MTQFYGQFSLNLVSSRHDSCENRHSVRRANHAFLFSGALLNSPAPFFRLLATATPTGFSLDPAHAVHDDASSDFHGPRLLATETSVGTSHSAASSDGTSPSTALKVGETQSKGSSVATPQPTAFPGSTSGHSSSEEVDVLKHLVRSTTTRSLAESLERSSLVHSFNVQETGAVSLSLEESNQKVSR
jgi:hypothetical protein